MQATQIAKLYEYILIVIYTIVIFLSISLPTGYIFGFNVKVATSLIAIIFFCMVVSTSRKPLNMRSIFMFLFSILFLSFWSLVGYLKNNVELKYALDAFKDFFSVFIILFLSYYLYKIRLITFQYFIRVLIYGNILFSLCKFTIVSVLYSGIIGYHELQSLLSPIFGDIFQGGNIYEGITRWVYPNDSITPFLLFFVLMRDKFKIEFSFKFVITYSVISYLSIFIAFTRYGIISCILISIICCILQKKFALIMVALSVILASALFQPVIDIYELRFTSTVTADSDSIRREQIEVLVEGISDNMFIGKGLSGYSNKMIRDIDKPYSYEVQWLSFALQFGILGLSLLLSFIVLMLIEILNHPIQGAKYGLLITYTIWLASGLTNPYLLSSISGCIFSLFLLATIDRSPQIEVLY